MGLDWEPIETAPKDGTVVWAWLYDTGIRRLRWATPQEVAAMDGGEPADYDGSWIEDSDPDEDWSPRFWLPLSAIPVPAEAA